MTTYQLIIGIGFLINIPDLIAILLMREGAEMTENGMVIRKADTLSGDALAHELKATVAERRSKMWSEFWRSIIATVIIGGIVIACYSVDLISLKLGVVKVGAYLWSFVITAAILAIGGIFYAVSSQIGAMNPGAAFDRVMKSVRDATEETTRQLRENFTAKPFWIYGNARHFDLCEACVLHLPCHVPHICNSRIWL